jgi:hypothetical protein
MSRDLIWIEQDRFEGWGCSACAWVFNSTGELPSKSFEELMHNFELQRDMAFTLHACADHPRAKGTKS